MRNDTMCLVRPCVHLCTVHVRSLSFMFINRHVYTVSSFDCSIMETWNKSTADAAVQCKPA